MTDFVAHNGVDWAESPKCLWPRPTHDDREFWEGARRGELRIQHCTTLRAAPALPAARSARTAGKTTLEWVTASGLGTVYSFTVVRQNGVPPFNERVPFVVAVVDLDEDGARMIAALPKLDPERGAHRHARARRVPAGERRARLRRLRAASSERGTRGRARRPCARPPGRAARGGACSTRPRRCSRRTASATCASSTSHARSARRPRPSTSTSATSKRPCSRSRRKSATRSRRWRARLDPPWDATHGLDDARALVDGFVDYWDRHRAVLRTRNLAAQEGDERFRDVRHRTLRGFMARLDRQDQRRARGRARGRRDVAGRRRARRWSRCIERMAAFQHELEQIGITRDDLVETTARIIHQTGRSAHASAAARAVSPATTIETASFASTRLDLLGRAVVRDAQPLVGRVRREQRERVDRVVGRPARPQVPGRDERLDEAHEVARGRRRRSVRRAPVTATSVRSSRMRSSCSGQWRHTAPSMSRSAVSGSAMSGSGLSSVERLRRRRRELVEHRALRAEVLVHRRARDAGLLGEHVHAEAVRAALAREARGRVEDARPRRAARAPGASDSSTRPALGRASYTNVSAGCGGLSHRRRVRTEIQAGLGVLIGFVRTVLRRRRRRATGLAARDRGFELALEHLLEQVAPAAHAPQLELGVVVGVEPQDHEVGADLDVDVVDDAPAARGRGRRRRRSSAASLRSRSRSSLSSAAKRGSDALGSPRRWCRTSAARNSISPGAKPRSSRVLDEVRGVPVVALARHVLADVVQQRRELEHLAVVVAETVQRARLVEQAQREARDVLRVRRRRSRTGARGRRPRRGAARAGRRTSRRDRGCCTASSTMPSRSAQSLVDHLVELEHVEDRGEQRRRPRGAARRACSSRPGSRRRSSRRHAHDAVVQRVGARLGVDAQAVRARRDRRRPSPARRPCRARSLIVPLVPTAIRGVAAAHLVDERRRAPARMRSSRRVAVGLRRRVVVHAARR